MAHGQVLRNIKHGGHIVPEDVPGAVELAEQGTVTLLSEAVDAGPTATLVETAVAEATFETPFDYLFPDLAHDPAALLPAGNPAQIVAALKALGDAMVEQPAGPGDELQATGNSPIPPVYTYWGQFIDHDLTANTDRDSKISDVTKPDLAPLDPDFVVAYLKNLRQPTLNLDSVYGDGPAFDGSPTEAASFYAGINFKIGRAADGPGIPGDKIPPEADLDRDLPRVDKKAQIADARNDENLIVAQLHTAFLRFHNNVVKALQAVPDDCGYERTERQVFEQAQRLTRWHYQWLVVHDFLKTVAQAGVVDKILLKGPKFYKPYGEPFMPLEFSVAGFRFGHTMVRAAYDHNRNFGRPGKVIPNASFDLLFAFTGNGVTPDPNDPTKVVHNPFLGTADTLPFNWIIEWDRFVDKGSSIPDHFARKIDTVLAPPLRDMVNEGNDSALPLDIKKILKRLARRNLLRGYLLGLPTGQSIAKKMKELGLEDVEPLSKDELRQGNSVILNEVLEENGFLERTPLWYYILKEAEVRENGNSLGAVGSRIVCETIIGQLLHDPESYLNQDGGWDPSKGVKLPGGDPIVSISDFLRFAGTLV